MALRSIPPVRFERHQALLGCAETMAFGAFVFVALLLLAVWP